MPRQPRLDIPDLVHHVIVRGIKGDKIFRDNGDRQNFVQRFHNLLKETGTVCYAWALIPNHFHLLLRPQKVPLSNFMRRLLTGYAVTFNRRYHRSGHLFQNRYKSIVCEEDVYLLELIRYIHLNPLRANLVTDIAVLDEYPWCGHAQVMGKRSECALDVASVRELFGHNSNSARKMYHQFIVDGVDMGSRPDLIGGGLRRSQVLCLEQDEMMDFDDRILGRSEFVTQLREQGLLDDCVTANISLSKLQQLLEQYYQLGEGCLLRRGRMTAASEARCIFCFCAVQWLHYSGADTARYLIVGESTVSRSMRKGEQIISDNKVIEVWLQQALKQ